jgi:hypothetical protein
MIRAEEIRTNGGQIQFSLAALGATGLQTKARSRQMATAVARDANRYELNLSAERVLIGFATAGGFIGVFLWALIRLWLFEP